MYGEKIVILIEGRPAADVLDERYAGFRALEHGQDFSMPTEEKKH
jgi:hypothetical protein